VKCDFDVTIGFPNFENFVVGVESEYDIRKIFGFGLQAELDYRSRSGVGVINKRFCPSLLSTSLKQPTTESKLTSTSILKKIS